jgi:hypothetical protein
MTVIEKKLVLTRGLPVAAAVSAVLNLLIFEYVTRVLKLPIVLAQKADEPLMPLGIGAVLGASIVPAAFAALMLVGLIALSRSLRRPVVLFYGIAAIFLAVSMSGPLGVITDTVSTKWVLVAMHIVAGVSIAGILGRVASAAAPECRA